MSGTVQSHAESLYLPHLPGSGQILVTNSSSEPEYLWIIFKSQDHIEERSFKVSAQGQLEIPEKDLDSDGMEYSIRTSSAKVQAQLQVQLNLEKEEWIAANNNANPNVGFQLRRGFESPPKTLSLALQNHNIQRQKIVVDFYDWRHLKLSTLELQSSEYFKTSIHELNVPARASLVEIRGEARLHARIQTSIGWHEGESLGSIRVEAPEDQTYILLSNDQRSESFVAALTDPDLIHRAREIIKTGSYEFLSGVIGPAKLSLNRAFHGPDLTPWSWSVTEVTNFATLGSQSCDGSPSIVEDSLPRWLAAKRICFWGFRLIRELTPQEVRSGHLK